MKRSTSHDIVWALVGAAALLLVVLVVLHFQPASVSSQVALRAKRQELVSQMRFHLASATDAEKGAVLATTDEQSLAFADQARTETASVDRLRTEFGMPQTDKEKGLLTEFQSDFSQFQQVDKEILDLAIKNTNLKAYALAFGPAAEAIKTMDTALSRLLAQSVSSANANAREVMLLAADADAGALRIEALLPPHIAEESDPKMDALEARMGKEDQHVQADLQSLQVLLPSSQDVATAKSFYERFTELRTQILKLSRENTNVRSLTISLNEMRSVTALCQDTLSALENTVKEEVIPGENQVNPR